MAGDEFPSAVGEPQRRRQVARWRWGGGVLVLVAVGVGAFTWGQAVGARSAALTATTVLAPSGDGSSGTHELPAVRIAIAGARGATPATTSGKGRDVPLAAGSAEDGATGEAAVDGALGADPGEAAHAPRENGAPAQRLTIERVLAILEGLYSATSTLSWEATRALVAHREQQRASLLRELAALGPGGALAIRERLSDALELRAELLLVEALGLVSDPAAPAILEAHAATAASLDVRRAALAALGRRTEARAATALGALARSEPHAGLRAGAVASMAHHPQGLVGLLERARLDPDLAVRAEAARALGRVPGTAGREALVSVAASVEEPRAVRAAAMHELARRHGAASLEVLERLVGAPDEPTRRDAVAALGRVGGDEAARVLHRVATEDPSADVRARAQAAIAQLR